MCRSVKRSPPHRVEVLTAFIREHSREQRPPSDAARPEQGRRTRPDIQAAVTVNGRRDSKRDILPIDLTGAKARRSHSLQLASMAANSASIRRLMRFGARVLTPSASTAGGDR